MTNPRLVDYLMALSKPQTESSVREYWGSGRIACKKEIPNPESPYSGIFTPIQKSPLVDPFSGDHPARRNPQWCPTL